MYDGCQSSSAPPFIFSQNQQEMPDIFSVVNFEYTACYCSTTEQHILLHMRRGVSTWCGTVICLLSNVTEFPVAEKKSVTKIQRQLKNFTASMLLTKCTAGHWTSKIIGQVELRDVHCTGQPTTTTTTTVTQALLQRAH
jgi:hypothetical protein